MGFLRRLLGDGDPATAPIDPGALDEEERERELELARFEQERANDLIRRQQRFATRSWTPPAQGGERRADDADEAPR
ncbi:MAG TPA: hypothetical protein VFK35_03655 [Candidatus Limnocylindrales bacterium]|nr:hypothetical protein [Candidatus Limnocylindrales bacterium]